ncbi:unnamed protein product [Ilex paraguariensis]|uniref:FAD/NAD(P)-binding domain-containing protein n=1 Tax=Ilex paraguariensis TaxID=185542 RepID=A0ABC8RFA5_9AQUA
MLLDSEDLIVMSIIIRNDDQVLSARKVQVLLGYFVRCIRRAGGFRNSQNPTLEANLDAAVAHDPEELILELQPAERGLQSQILEADLVLWTVGSKPLLPMLEPSDSPHGLPLNARGQAETDETLCVKGHPRIFAIGDSSSLRESNGKLLPATAQVAFQQADFVGWNLWAGINDRPLLPFRFETQTHSLEMHQQKCRMLMMMSNLPATIVDINNNKAQKAVARDDEQQLDKPSSSSVVIGSVLRNDEGSDSQA